MRVLRLDPDLAIIPSAIAAVAVEPRFETVEDHPMTFRPVQRGHNVVVQYLMAETSTVVASFGPTTTRTSPLMGAPLYTDDELARLLVESEARAHVVYEAILQAIKDEAA